MRGELAQRGLSGTAIDAFLGHGGASGDPLAQVSASALADMDALEAVLDAIWNDLGLVLPEAFA